MQENDFNRVVYYSKRDITTGYNLKTAELILRSDNKDVYSDVNEVLELYNIKKYIDNKLYLKSWTTDDILYFQQKVKEYGQIIGQYMALINDDVFLRYYETVIDDFSHSFWQLINDLNIFKRISRQTFKSILTKDSYIIHEILQYKKLVKHFDNELKSFLMTYPKSAEILLSIYEEQQDLSEKDVKHLPMSLTLKDKEDIILNYLNSSNTNLNYINLIQGIRNNSNLRVSDKTRLKSKRLYEREMGELMTGNSFKLNVTVNISENMDKIKDIFLEGTSIHYSYSLDYIKQNKDLYSLFLNFKTLFEYIDEQGRISLVSKPSEMDTLEKLMGTRSVNHYENGIVFNLFEMSSSTQIAAYEHTLNQLNISLEEILKHVFTSTFQDKYIFAKNAHFMTPSATSSDFEKIRILAPEFESILKQFKLFVEDGNIDFELLQISSSPSAVKDIPSLNTNKYIYLNKKNEVIQNCFKLLFSNQVMLRYVDPFKDKKHSSFFDLIINEEVYFDYYKEHYKQKLNYLIEHNIIAINDKGAIEITNYEKLGIFKDLYDNEVASFYHYPENFKEEAQRLVVENAVYFDSSLFSKPEQEYFNFYLNKSEHTNGLDLRNSYLHGTQAKSSNIEEHRLAYLRYLKLLTLLMLKIEDDLDISQTFKNETSIV